MTGSLGRRPMAPKPLDPRQGPAIRFERLNRGRWLDGGWSTRLPAEIHTDAAGCVTIHVLDPVTLAVIEIIAVER